VTDHRRSARRFVRRLADRQGFEDVLQSLLRRGARITDGADRAGDQAPQSRAGARSGIVVRRGLVLDRPETWGYRGGPAYRIGADRRSAIWPRTGGLYGKLPLARANARSCRRRSERRPRIWQVSSKPGPSGLPFGTFSPFHPHEHGDAPCPTAATPAPERPGPVGRSLSGCFEALQPKTLVAIRPATRKIRGSTTLDISAQKVRPSPGYGGPGRGHIRHGSSLRDLRGPRDRPQKVPVSRTAFVPRGAWPRASDIRPGQFKARGIRRHSAPKQRSGQRAWRAFQLVPASPPAVVGPSAWVDNTDSDPTRDARFPTRRRTSAVPQGRSDYRSSSSV